MGGHSLATKHCTRCKEEKSASEFYPDQSKKDGLSTYCRACSKVDSRRRYHSGAALSSVLSQAKIRAVKQGLPFDLSVESVPPVPTHCPALGVELKRGGLKEKDNSPSLDRIIPEKGYVPGNVIWVSQLANQIKTNATPEQIIRVGTFYQQLIGGSDDTSRSP